MGYPFILVTAVLAAIFAASGVVSLAILLSLLSLFICYFFRDPDRNIPEQSDAVVSPADGRVIKAGRVIEHPMGEGHCVKISIFMSVFNVHVNRIPHDGKVTRIDYRPGKFFSANLDKASEQNEHNSVILETNNGNKICFVQIAGLIARRIICKIKAGDSVARGERFGMICFGFILSTNFCNSSM